MVCFFFYEGEHKKRRIKTFWIEHMQQWKCEKEWFFLKLDQMRKIFDIKKIGSETCFWMKKIEYSELIHLHQMNRYVKKYIMEFIHIENTYCAKYSKYLNKNLFDFYSTTKITWKMLFINILIDCDGAIRQKWNCAFDLSWVFNLHTVFFFLCFCFLCESENNNWKKK